MYWFIYGFYGLYILDIYVVIMLVINMYYDIDDVYLSSCFDLYMNAQCIYDAIDDNAANDIRQQCF